MSMSAFNSDNVGPICWNRRSRSYSNRMKRILALDGGGIKGLFTLQILERIEQLFREREGNSKLVLADVFDLFAGTSTGAVIATCLCWGMGVSVGTKKLRGLLLVVVRNASTGSAWPVTNNPKAVFNDPALPNCNLNIPLWQLLRASTAAPTYFAPERIRLGEEEFLFVDGGITPYNNPSLLALLTATLPHAEEHVRVEHLDPRA